MRLRRRPGFTLIELSFSMVFYTAIVVTALTAFVGILGVYNKAQSLTRTQNASRIAIDTVVRDVRTAKDIQKFELHDSTDNPIAGATDALSTSLRAQARDYYCITSDAGSRGYANLWKSETNKFVLVRLSRGCNTFEGYEQVVDSDVWSDATGSAVSSGVVASATDPRSLKVVNGKDYRGLVITRIGTAAPAVWQVQVSVYRGTRVPPDNTGLLDQFSAATTLRTVVASRE